jgi:transposase
MSRHELTDQQWAVIEKLIPSKKSGVGRPQADPGKTLNGILYVLKTGCAWADLPRKYGSYTTCWRRLREWQRTGIWEKIWRKLLQMLDEKRAIDWSRGFLDGSFVAAKRGGDQVGKTRIGKGSKVMVIADGNGLPIGIYVTSANHHEIKLAQPTL